MHKPNRGFTLIEILITMAIISILMAVSFWGFQGARISARDAKRTADLETIRTALEIYKADCGIYPLTPYPRTYTTNWPTNIAGSGATTNCAVANIYLAATPKDPLDPTRYYRYYSPDGVTYCLAASQEGTSTAASCNGVNLCGTTALCNIKVTNP